MRLISICSSSNGNCTYIESCGKGLLVDVGCSYTALQSVLKLAGRSVDDINAVVITHEHSDHISGLDALTNNNDLPVYASEGTLGQIIQKNKLGSRARPHLINDLANAPVELKITAFHTPHDSKESVGYTFSDPENKIAVCTDLGEVTPEVRSNLVGSRFVLLESNYDEYMLKKGEYPAYLKERIRSNRGHLSNDACAEFLKELVRTGTVSVLLGHLSPKNNTPELAVRTSENALAEAGAFKGRDYMLETAAVTGSGKAFAI